MISHKQIDALSALPGVEWITALCNVRRAPAAGDDAHTFSVVT